MIGAVSSVGPYSHKTKVGNWSEDRHLHEMRVKDYLEKKKNGQLLVDSVNAHLTASLKPAPLSFSNDGYVHYGDAVMLFNVETDAVLSTDTSDKVGFAQEACAVTASTLSKGPVARNVFTIESVEDGIKPGDQLKLGDRFRLRMHDSLSNEPMYLQSHATASTLCAKCSRYQLVSVGPASKDGVWKAQFKQASQRFEMELEPVPANAEIVLFHDTTNQMLAADTKFKFANGFGVEFEVSAHSHLTVSKKHGLYAEQIGKNTADIPVRSQLPQNHWAFLTAASPQSSQQAPLESKWSDEVKVPESSTAKLSSSSSSSFPSTASAAVQQLRTSVVQRGWHQLHQLAQILSARDQKQTGILSRDQFLKALSDVGVVLAPSVSEALIKSFATEAGAVAYALLLQELQGATSEARAQIVDKAFASLDSQQRGWVEWNDLKARYNVRSNPLYPKVGSRTEEQGHLRAFLANFEGDAFRGRITNQQFKEYYRNLNASITEDRAFVEIVKQSWGLRL